MFNFTPQERKAVLFLVTIGLCGLTLHYAAKMNSRLRKFVTVDINSAKIDLNQASLEDLLRSRCLSPKLAQKIIDYRNANGLFKDLEELKEIKGIGDYRCEKLKDIFFLP